MINRGSQHSLGLDARLSRCIESQQVHHDVADDGQVAARIALAMPVLDSLGARTGRAYRLQHDVSLVRGPDAGRGDFQHPVKRIGNGDDRFFI